MLTSYLGRSKLIGLRNIARSFSMTVTDSVKMEKKVIVVSGPSGSGKSTLLKKLFLLHPGKFGFSISHTTRSPREGEENGREYYFVSRDEFNSLNTKGEFLEWAEFSKNLYATSVSSVKRVLDEGRSCILDIDLQGVKSVKQVGQSLQPTFIYIKPPTFESLKARLLARNTESTESLNLRLQAAEEDMKFIESNPGFFDAVVINDNVEEAYKSLESVIFD